MKTLELVRTFNPSKGEINGLTETSRRINSLRSNFKNQYLEKAKEILKEKEREYKP